MAAKIVTDEGITIQIVEMEVSQPLRNTMFVEKVKTMILTDNNRQEMQVRLSKEDVETLRFLLER